MVKVESCIQNFDFHTTRLNKLEYKTLLFQVYRRAITSSMINNFFKPAWKHHSPDKRIRAIEGLSINDEESTAIIESIIREDADLEVRKVGLERLGDPRRIFEISHSHPDKATRNLALQRFCEYIGAKTQLTEHQLQQISVDLPKAKILIATHCPYDKLQDSLLSTLSDNEIASILEQIPLNETRYRVADRLMDRESLEKARSLLKGKDKSTEKLIKSKIDAINAAHRLSLSRSEISGELCHKMESLAAIQDWREETKNSFLVLCQRWAALDFEPDQNVTRKFDTARLKVEKTINHNTEIAESLACQERLTSELEESCRLVSAADLDTLINDQQALASRLTNNSHEWTRQNNITQHKLEVSERFIESAKALEDVLELARMVAKSTNSLRSQNIDQIEPSHKALRLGLENLSWPKRFSRLSLVDEIEELIKNLEKASKNLAAQTKNKQDELHKKLNRLLNISQKGNVKRSRQELKRIRRATEGLPDHDRKALDEKIAAADAAITKFADWNDFVTEPKLIALCDQMEALATKDNPNADKQAKKIKSLQSSWKALASSDISEQYWPRFKLAADTAYEPCSNAFRERREQQKQNLQKRTPLIKSLQQLLAETNWEANPDYSSIESALNQINKDWKKIKNVEQKTGQKQWEQFNSLKEDIYGQLAPEYQRNLELKKELIMQLENMVENGVDDSHFPKLQLIQAKWKQVGITRRHQDQKAWKTFKNLSDGIYAQIKESRNAIRTAQKQQVDLFRNTINGIIKLSKNRKSLAEGDQRFDELKQQYSDLPALPKELAEKAQVGLDKDYARACRAYEQSREKMIRDKENRNFTLIVQAAELCNQLEALPSSCKKIDVDALIDEVKSIELVDKKIAGKLSKRIDLARVEDRKEFTDARRALCIEMEILANVDSPAADQGTRTEIQLARLQRGGIGQVAANSSSMLRKMHLNWLCLPGAEPTEQAQFDKRVDSLLKAANIKVSKSY